MCVMNIRRSTLRKKSSNINTRATKQKTPDKARKVCRRIDDLQNSVERKSINRVRNSLDTKFKLCKSPQIPKNSYSMDDLLFVTSTEGHEKTVLKKATDSAIKLQSVTSKRKRKSSQPFLARNISHTKKRKKETENSCKTVSHHSLGVLNACPRKSSGKSNNAVVSENSIRISPRLAAKKTVRRLRDRKITRNQSVKTVPNRPKIIKKNKGNLLEKTLQKNVKSKSRRTKNKSDKLTFIRTMPVRQICEETPTQVSQKHAAKNSNETSRICRKLPEQNSPESSTRRSPRLLEQVANSSPKNNFSAISESNLGIPPAITRSASKLIVNPKIASVKRQFKEKDTTSKPKRKYDKKKNTLRNKSILTDSAINLTPQSKETSQANQFPFGNIPTDDLIKAKFFTPSNIGKRPGSRKALNNSSTPLLKKNYRRQLKKGGVKKSNFSPLSDGILSIEKKSFPSKGTLKRKRWLINTMKEKNEGYEDDIFENNKFDHFKDVLQFDDDSDSSMVSIDTPRCPFLITPTLPTKTPRFKDCYSPVELLKARKIAEEYMHRRNKKRKSDLALLAKSQEKMATPENKICKNTPGSGTSSSIPEKMKLDFMSVIEQCSKKQEEMEKEIESDEDVYFSDVSS